MQTLRKYWNINVKVAKALYCDPCLSPLLVSLYFDENDDDDDDDNNDNNDDDGGYPLFV